MSRRVRLPGADELFRPTSAHDDPVRPGASPDDDLDDPQPEATAEVATSPRGSGRVRHDEKITVYVTAEELLNLEHTRLVLRREHGLAVDRGRLVREAIHLTLESVRSDGADSSLVRRLREQ